MISSINVNNFVGQNNWMNLQGDFVKKIEIWNSMKDYYFEYIKEHLKFENDVVILHEVPYIKEKEYTYNGQKNFKRSVIKESEANNNDYCKIFIELKSFCSSSGYDLLISNSSDTSFFVTVGICKNNQYKILESQFENYKKRIIVLENKQNPKKIVIGVHIKDDSYWNELITLFTNINNDNKEVIIIGDMNVFIPGTSQKKYFNKLLSKGLCDAWIESGNSHFDATYVSGTTRTRIDYALLSDSCCNKYKMFKEDSIRLLGYSDHSTIILNELSN